MERTAGVVGRAADGRWRPLSVVVAIRTRTECGEHIVRQTALGSVTVWRTAQQIDSTVFVNRITRSTHCTNSELGVSPRFTALSIFIQQRLTWKCREIASTFWTQRWSCDFWSYGSKQVKTGQHGWKTGLAGQRQRRGYGNAAAVHSLCVSRYKEWLVQIHMQMCKSTTYWTLR